MSTTLDCLEKGEQGTICDLTGEQSFITRATAIGFCPGVEISVIQNCNRYPLIVYLNDTRIAIDRSEAEKVIVHERA